MERQMNLCNFERSFADFFPRLRCSRNFPRYRNYGEGKKKKEKNENWKRTSVSSKNFHERHKIFSSRYLDPNEPRTTPSDPLCAHSCTRVGMRRVNKRKFAGMVKSGEDCAETRCNCSAIIIKLNIQTEKGLPDLSVPEI